METTARTSKSRARGRVGVKPDRIWNQLQPRCKHTHCCVMCDLSSVAHPPRPRFLQGFFRKRKTSNLEAYVNWFNRLSYLVATEICMVGSNEQNSPR